MLRPIDLSQYATPKNIRGQIIDDQQYSVTDVGFIGSTPIILYFAELTEQPDRVTDTHVRGFDNSSCREHDLPPIIYYSTNIDIKMLEIVISTNQMSAIESIYRAIFGPIKHSYFSINDIDETISRMHV